MKNITNIIIANDAEAFNAIIGKIKDEAKYLEKVNKEHFLSGRFLFWEGDNKIVITPFEVDQTILDQLPQLGYTNFESWSPKGKGINLCEEIQRDTILLEKLKDVLRNNSGVVFSPYSYTKEFVTLIEELKKEGFSFAVDQEPEGGQWLVEYLGSKIGFRLEAEKIKINSPEFFICKSKEEIINAGKWFFQLSKSFVIKSSIGEGGWGVLVVKKEQSEDFENNINFIEQFHKDPIWEEGLFIVEEFIESKQEDGSSPSVELFINNDKIQITYICNQIVDREGKFIGILMGKNCIKWRTWSKIYSIAKKVGNRYQKLGYRGFFDVDFIISKTGKPYPVETNVRRTGGTHVFDLAKFIFGKRWEKRTVCLSKDSFVYKGEILTASEIIKKIDNIKFPIDQTREGVIIVAVSKDTPVFSFVIFALTKSRALNIYQKLTNIFQ